MSGSKTKDEITVPEGFTIEVDGYGRNADVIHCEGTGYVTVDWEKRCFRAGATTYGQSLTTKSYKGPGWRQKLVDDAVKWLQEISR